MKQNRDAIISRSVAPPQKQRLLYLTRARTCWWKRRPPTSTVYYCLL